MKLNDFHYAMYLANALFNISILPEDFEEVGLVAYRLIGNKNTTIHSKCLVPDCNNIVTLPCDCDAIEAITYDFEDWNHSSNKYPFGEYSSQFVEGYTEAFKLFSGEYYIPGKLAIYQQINDNQIQLKDNYGNKVFILYKSESLDDGLPLITDAEALAIATFIAYTTKFKEGILTNNPDTVKMAQFLLQEWNRRCDAARVSSELTQNEIDEILNSKTSWDRKQYNKSFKALK